MYCTDQEYLSWTLFYQTKWCSEVMRHVVSQPFFGGGTIMVPWHRITQIANFMGPTWGPPGSCRPQMGPMKLAIRAGFCNNDDRASVDYKCARSWNKFKWLDFEIGHWDSSSSNGRRCDMLHFFLPCLSKYMSCDSFICVFCIVCIRVNASHFISLAIRLLTKILCSITTKKG